jgi:hypothetical protein
MVADLCLVVSSGHIVGAKVRLNGHIVICIRVFVWYPGEQRRQNEYMTKGSICRIAVFRQAPRGAKIRHGMN